MPAGAPTPTASWCSPAPATRSCTSSSARPLLGVIGGRRPPAAARRAARCSARRAGWSTTSSASAAPGRRRRVRRARVHARRRAPAVRRTGAAVDVRTVPRGYAGLGSMFWLLTALALVLYLIGAVVVLAQPDERNLLYGLTALAQTTQPAVDRPRHAAGVRLCRRGWAQLDLWLRIACDLVTGAACVHALSVHPRRLPPGPDRASRSGRVGIGFIATVALQPDPGAVVVGAGDAARLLRGRLRCCSPGRTASSRTRWPS